MILKIIMIKKIIIQLRKKNYLNILRKKMNNKVKMIMIDKKDRMINKI
jgi:hypothetical protein